MFKRRAQALHAEVVDYIQTNFNKDFQLQLDLNPNGAPPRGSFEVFIAPKPTDEKSERTELWSGVKRTPRAQKFPTVEVVAEKLVEVLCLRT